MRIGLQWKDYCWTVLVLAICFVLLPVGLWKLSAFREAHMQVDAKHVIQRALIDADVEIHRAATELEMEHMRGFSDKPYHSPELEADVKTACDALRASVKKQTSEFKLANYNCFFYTERVSGKYLRATESNIYFPDDSLIEELQKPSLSTEFHLSTRWSSAWQAIVPIYMEDARYRDYTESKKFISFVLSSTDD